jgi:hypothetical protein
VLANLGCFARVKPLPLLQELFTGLLVLRVGDTGIYRANIDALLCFVATDTLGAFIRVNDIDGFPLGDCLVRTLRLAGTTTDTLFCNFVWHKIYFLLTLFLLEWYCSGYKPYVL